MSASVSQRLPLMPVQPFSADQQRLDGLRSYSTAEIEAAFRDAPLPTTDDLVKLEGESPMRGLGLISPFRGRKLFARELVGPGFFWTGKSFRREDDETLFGHNIFLGAGGVRAFPFVSTVGPSLLDDRPCVRIEYSHPRIKGTKLMAPGLDEIREVEPDLWMGPGYLRTKRRNMLVAWFALDFTVGRD